MCIVISSQVNIEPSLSLFNRWCYSSVVLFRFFSFSIKLSKDWLNFMVMAIIVFFISFHSFFHSYRLCHYNKRLNNRRTTRIVIGKWLYTINFCFCICSYMISLFSSLLLLFLYIWWIKFECTLYSKVNFVVLRSIICAIYIRTYVYIHRCDLNFRTMIIFWVLYNDETISIYRHYIPSKNNEYGHI